MKTLILIVSIVALVICGWFFPLLSTKLVNADDTTSWAGYTSFNVLPDGTWLLAYVVINTHINRAIIYGKESTDNGTTWDEEYIIFDEGNCAEIAVMPDEVVWVFVSRVALRRIDYKIQSANGTWGNEQTLPDVVEGGYPYCLGNHFLSVGGMGYLPIYVRSDVHEASSADIKVGLYSTSDNGASWQYSFLDSAGWDGRPGSEAGIAYTGNNTLLAIWRDVAKEDNTVWQSKSYDRGSTWQKVKNIGSSANGTLPWLADVELTWFGEVSSNLVLSAITDKDVDGTRGLSAWLSTDNGTTWGDEFQIIKETTGTIGYHGIEYVGDGRAYLVTTPQTTEHLSGMSLTLNEGVFSLSSPIVIRAYYPPPSPPPPSPTSSDISVEGISGSGGGGASAESVGITTLLHSMTESGVLTENVTARSGDKNVQVELSRGIAPKRLNGGTIWNIRIKEKEYAVKGDTCNVSMIYSVGLKSETLSIPAVLRYNVPDNKNLVIVGWDDDHWTVIDTKHTDDYLIAEVPSLGIYGVMWVDIEKETPEPSVETRIKEPPMSIYEAVSKYGYLQYIHGSDRWYSFDELLNNRWQKIRNRAGLLK